MSRAMPRAPKEDRPLKPIDEREPADILAAILGLFWICRLEEHRARGALFVVCDRGHITKRGVATTYIERELPMREASELLAWTLRGYAIGHEWRWRLCLCPSEDRTMTGIHVLLMAPPQRGRPRSEPTWMRTSEADQRGCRGRPEPSSPGTTLAQDGPSPRATMGAEL